MRCQAPSQALSYRSEASGTSLRSRNSLVPGGVRAGSGVTDKKFVQLAIGDEQKF